jgi:hypothetical protein
MAIALFLTHGINAESSIALSGTVAALGLTVVLGWIFTKFCQLSGMAVDSATAVRQFSPNVSLTGLLVAGMVIGALGVLDDVTVTQAAAVWELSAANPAANRRELFAAGLRIGRTHVASVVNTLVLAYAGVAMPVLIVFGIQGLPARYVLSTETVAMEIVRGLVGSLGIIAAVPLTTALAAMAVAVVALAMWLPHGPLGRDWARRAGTPVALLTRPATAAAAQTAAASSLRLPFTARARGTLRSGIDRDGTALIDIALRVKGRGTLDVRLQGQPLDGGGIRVSRSQVTFGPTGDPDRYIGRLVSLDGTTLDARVRPLRGRAVRVRALLDLGGNAGGGPIAATVSARQEAR